MPDWLLNGVPELKTMPVRKEGIDPSWSGIDLRLWGLFSRTREWIIDL